MGPDIDLSCIRTIGEKLTFIAVVSHVRDNHQLTNVMHGSTIVSVLVKFSFRSICTSVENMLPTRFLALLPNRRRRSVLCSSLTIFSAMDAGSRGLHNNPETPSSITSGPGPVSLATTPLPIAIPSSQATGMASMWDGKTQTEAAAINFGSTE